MPDRRKPLPRMKLPSVDDSGIELIGREPHPVEDEERGFMGPRHEIPILEAERFTFGLIKLWGGIVAITLLLFWLLKG